MQSGSEILTNKVLNRSTSIKSLKSHKVQEAKSATVMQKALIPKDFEFISDILHNHFLFKDLDREVYLAIIRTMKYFKLAANEIIFNQGDKGKHLFIIVKGLVDILVNGVKIKTLGVKDMFGEVALMHDVLRTASVVSKEKTEMWALERSKFREAIRTVAAKQFHDNRICIEKCELFVDLDDKCKTRLLEIVVAQVYENQIIAREGEIGTHLYVVKYGRVKLFVEGKDIGELREGEYFGELSMVNENFRTATAKAVNRVVLLSFEPKDLQKIIGSSYFSMVYKNSLVISFKNDQFLNKLMHSQMIKVAEAMDRKKYRAKEYLLKKGKDIKKIVVVLKGTVKRENQLLSKYSCIGSEILIEHYTTEFSYKCQSSVETAEITKTRFEEVLSGNLSSLCSENSLIIRLTSNPLLSNLPESSLRSMIKSINLCTYTDNEVICRQFTPGSSMFIILSGEVKFTIDGEYVRSLSSGSYFGERALLTHSNRTATATSKNSTSLLVISRDIFEQFVDVDMRNQLQLRIHLQDDSISLEDLHLLKLLGSGMFGAVFLAVHRGTRALYAVKSISKYDLRRLKIKKNIKSAEEVLLKLDCPLIMRLVKVIQDPERVYFVQEYIDGKNFLEFIEDSRPFNEFHVKFYISNIVLMLRYLNQMRFAHRDLKPDNMILDVDGYLKLIDFDTAKKIKERSYTVAGTPHYMAPEMIRGNGYDLAVDYWSLGVILYEIVYGYLPFANFTDDPIEIYQVILMGRVEFRNRFVRFRGIIEKLLDSNPGKRPDWNELETDEFFAGINWDLLLRKKIVPPFKPKATAVEVKEWLPEFSTQIIVEEELRRINFKCIK